MEKFFKILNSLPGLSGLYIRANLPETQSNVDYIEVSEIITNTVVGDRDLKFPIPPSSLWISCEHLQEIQDPTKQYSSASPFGKHLRDATIKDDEINVAYSVFDNAISVTVYEIQDDKSQKTLYSQNFFKNKERVLSELIMAMNGDTDVQDIPLILQELE